MSSPPIPDAPHGASEEPSRVTAVLVVTDGAEWLRHVLAMLGRQQYPAFDLVVVDNASTDGSSDVLGRRIPSDRLISLRRRVGFARAVAAASQHGAVTGADFVLLCHDDLVLHPDAVSRLVEALQDPSLSVVGPKLREWSEEPLLQEVGMTADRLGRAENHLEPGELDQGQHDRQRHTLYVSTAGMMFRVELLRKLGGLDPRFTAFRDDLDFCWRAWLTGHGVAVVPAAVGYHVGASSRLARRVGRGGPSEARALAERNTVATLLKNYSTARLLWVLPAVLVLAVGKIVGFLASRRFGDALAVVRAYLWNAAQLPRTLRRRRVIQARRTVDDAELAQLFARGLPRLRGYAEFAGAWLAGGGTPALIEEAEEGGGIEQEASSGLVRFVRRYPSMSAGAALLAVYLVGLVPLLGSGQLVGGQVAPWPESAREFLRAYASHWSGDPVGSGAFASPIQVVLGLGSFLGFGSAWLAQRLLVLGLVPLAWMLALRAGRLITARPAPRLLGATLYALSPAIVALLAEGRFGMLVFAALLPGLVMLTVRVLSPETRIVTAWRAAALLALGLAVVGAAAPTSAPLLLLGYVATLAVAFRDRRLFVRMLVAGVGALAVLAPWVVDAARHGLGPQGEAPSPVALWRALTAAPPLVAGLGVLEIVAVATAVGVVVGAVLLGLRSRPGAVSALVTVVALAGLAAWGLGLEQLIAGGAQLVPALLVVVALALAGLGAIGARWLVAELRAYAFGARQLAAVGAAGLVAVGVLGGVAQLAIGPWHGLSREPDLVPAFVGADEPQVGPYRVLLLAATDELTWDLVGPDGPSMLNYGTLPGKELVRHVDDAITAAAGGADPRAGAALGVANVRYVVVSDLHSTKKGAAEVTEAFASQPELEPLPSGGGRVFGVRLWLPRAVVLPPDLGETLLATGDPGSTDLVAQDGLDYVQRGVYSGSLTGTAARGEGGVLVVSESRSGRWQAHAGDRSLERRPAEAVNAFAVPADADRVTAEAAGGIPRVLMLGLQALVASGLVSLAVRPPVFARRRVERVPAESLPGELTAHSERPPPAGQEYVPS